MRSLFFGPESPLVLLLVLVFVLVGVGVFGSVCVVGSFLTSGIATGVKVMVVWGIRGEMVKVWDVGIKV